LWVSIAIGALGLMGAIHFVGDASAAKVIPHVQTCGNSFPADGHNAPWFTNGDSTIHGNIVSVDCPGPNVHWDLTYKVQKQGTGSWLAVINVNRSGNGSPSDFGYLTDYNCQPGFIYRTHIENNITGGTINKPSGGAGVLACGP
jgi:hypothetical protein